LWHCERATSFNLKPRKACLAALTVQQDALVSIVVLWIASFEDNGASPLTMVKGHKKPTHRFGGDHQSKRRILPFVEYESGLLCLAAGNSQDCWQNGIQNKSSTLYISSTGSYSEASPFLYCINDCGTCLYTVTRNAISYKYAASAWVGKGSRWCSAG
jgi:hypothetical protein